MKGCLTVLVLLSVLVVLGLVVPIRLIGTGLDDFGDRERRMAAKALFHGPELYGSGFLEIGDYSGPPLVLGRHVEGVEECPPLPGGETPEEDSYRAYGGGAPGTERTASSASPGERWRSTVAVAGDGSRTSERLGAHQDRRGLKADGQELTAQKVGTRGFEPPTSSSRTRRATRLRYVPTE